MAKIGDMWNVLQRNALHILPSHASSIKTSARNLLWVYVEDDVCLSYLKCCLLFMLVSRLSVDIRAYFRMANGKVLFDGDFDESPSKNVVMLRTWFSQCCRVCPSIVDQSSECLNFGVVFHTSQSVGRAFVSWMSVWCCGYKSFRIWKRLSSSISWCSCVFRLTLLCQFCCLYVIDASFRGQTWHDHDILSYAIRFTSNVLC